MRREQESKSAKKFEYLKEIDIKTKLYSDLNQ